MNIIKAFGKSLLESSFVVASVLASSGHIKGERLFSTSVCTYVCVSVCACVCARACVCVCVRALDCRHTLNGDCYALVSIYIRYPTPPPPPPPN